MRQTLFTSLVTTVALGVVAGSAQADTSFAPGSLIIPTNAAFVDKCGSVAAYGLVYNVLRANEWLAANGYGTIEVYYGYKETKLSPNRCTPTNRHAGAAYPASAAGELPAYAANAAPTHNNAKWNDGCDFEIVDGSLGAAVPPMVKLVNKTSAAAACAPAGAPPYAAVTTCATDSVITTINTTAAGYTDVFPRWTSQAIQHTAVAGTNVTNIRYSGGPFIISDADAPVFLRLISGGLSANDKADGSGNWISFTNFSAAGCTFGTTVGGNVAIHRAYVGFTAPTPKIFTSTPPRLALLARNGNQSPASGGSSSSPGTASYTDRVDDGILQDYLKNAGLNFTGAQGCPIGGYLATNVPSACPMPNKVGQIYDLFDFRDLASGALVSPTYKMLWAPHWETKNGPTANEQTAINSVATFLNGQAGLMAECASIESLEGIASGGDAIPSGQFQSCVGSGTTCAGAPTTTGFVKNSAVGGYLRNCTDMSQGSGTSCVYYSSPGDGFAQVGDFLWESTSSSRVADFKPRAGSIYRSSVSPLISGVNSLARGNNDNGTTARSMIQGDFVTRSYKDNDTTKSSVLYLGGHDLTNSVAGTKVVLQTLLQLGNPVVDPTIVEVTRSSPIIATIGSTTSLVQGTFERVTPPPTTLTANTTAELTTFRFPDVKGHLRAVDLSIVGTTAVDFDSVPSANVVFDAATLIPATTSTYSGCGGGAFRGACRTIFTHTASGPNPTRLLFEASNVNTIGAAIATGSTLATSDYPTLLSRIIAGIETAPSSGVFTAKLGGVDRSTVAVVPYSLVAGSSTRPTMVYFGAADGMLHAVCGQVDNTRGCDTVGRELWAFIPRLQLQLLRKNTAKVDGSPRVMDLFGDFYGTGVRSFRTILMFQTGNGDNTIAGQQPSVTALDITDVNDPQILWDASGPASPGSLAMGKGLIVNGGKVNTATTFKSVAFVQTNNGGTGGAGDVVTAINIEDGTQLWQTGYLFTNPPRGAGTPVPATGIPGGAVGLDKQQNGSLSEVVMGTLYGDIWQLDAATGVNRHGANPLFRYGSNLHPFGTPPTLYSSSGSFYALMVPGAYADPAALSLWTTPSQTAVAVSLSTPVANAPLSETSGSPYVPWTFTLDSGDKSFSQAVVIGGEVFITADSEDVNSLTYGTTAGDTGRVYKVNLSNPATVVAYDSTGGAGSIAATSSAVYMGSKTAMQALAGAPPANTGDAVNSATNGEVTRRLWLRTL
jgi:hypothetical protein